jgi:hypothetical protein
MAGPRAMLATLRPGALHRFMCELILGTLAQAQMQSGVAGIMAVRCAVPGTSVCAPRCKPGFHGLAQSLPLTCRPLACQGIFSGVRTSAGFAGEAHVC